MFDRIAPVYDLMNRVMTVGLDQRWRRLTVREVVSAGDRVLDGCCGTGDLAVAARKAGAGEVIGLDFSARMLERARRKEPAIEWIQGDLLELPFEDGSFDAATVGFGVRNVADLERGLAELRRVLKPGRPRRHPRDHEAEGAAEALLQALVRRPDPARRQGPAGRQGVHVPARERPPLPRPGRAGRADAGGTASATSPIAGSAAASSRCTRGRPRDHTRGRRRAARRRRLHGAGRGPARRRGRLARRQRRRGRAAMRSPRAASGCGRCSRSSARRRTRSRRSRRASRSSSCTWRRSSTTT